MSFKQNFLNKSNSYVYYKQNYETLKESQKDLEENLDKSTRDRDYYKMHFDFVGDELKEKRDTINALSSEKRDLIIENNYLKYQMDVYHDELISLNNIVSLISSRFSEFENLEEFAVYIKLFDYKNRLDYWGKDIKKLHKNDLAGIHIKNIGNRINSVEIIGNSDENSVVSSPSWICNDEGRGIVLESYSGNIDFKIKIINDGILDFSLRSLNMIDENNKKIKLWIDYTSLIIDGVNLLDGHNLHWHDEPFVFKKCVKDSEILDVHLEWVTYERMNYYEKYDDKSIIYQNIRNDLLKLNFSDDSLKKMPIELYDFYIKVLNNENYDNFVYFNRKLKDNYNFINKKEVQDEFDKFDGLGINTEKRDDSIIVSLTSFPERMDDIHFCLYSLLSQSFKPDKVVLWLAIEQFPNKEDDVPADVLKLKENGLTIEWCNDIRSYKKLIPPLEKYPDSFIVTADDDIYYHEDWLENIWNTYLENPNNIISSRLRKILGDSNKILGYNTWKLSEGFEKPSFLNFPTGAGGTMYFPGALSDKVFDEDTFIRLCPTADDIWFWAMAVLNDTKIVGIDNPYNLLTYVNISREVGINDAFTLWHINQLGKNDEQINNVLNAFPEILDRLYKD